MGSRGGEIGQARHLGGQRVEQPDGLVEQVDVREIERHVDEPVGLFAVFPPREDLFFVGRRGEHDTDERRVFLRDLSVRRGLRFVPLDPCFGRFRDPSSQLVVDHGREPSRSRRWSGDYD